MAPVTMKLSFRYGSHLPVLLKAVLKTQGDILELGAGIFSTPMLHAFSMAQNRNVVTYENFNRWYRWFSIYEGKRHKVHFINKWEDAVVEKPWDVVLVDQTPDEDRIKTIARLADYAKYIVVHDANEGSNTEKTYHFSKIYHLFKYRYHYRDVEPNVMVLSNFVDLEGFMENA